MPRKASPKQRFASSLLRWFQANRREFPWRSEKDPYRILVAEKLLQQTTAGHALKAYSALIEKYVTPSAMAAANVGDIEQIIKPLGFWRFRAQQLKAMTRQIVDIYGGTVPQEKEQLLTLAGVGEYIAKATSCFAFFKHEAVVDVNVRKVANRIFFWGGEMPDDLTLSRYLLEVIPSGHSREFNWAMIDFASSICTRKPRCGNCFASAYCRYARLENSAAVNHR